MSLLVIAYHYLENESKYSGGIYPTGPDRFELQLRTMKDRGYTFLSEDDLVTILDGRKSMPEKGALITFDDGLISHYETALPILQKHQVHGIFSIPTAHLAGEAYVTHKVHYLLSLGNEESLLDEVQQQVADITGNAIDWDSIGLDVVAKTYRYDTQTVGQFKFLMNYHLEKDVAKQVVDSVFAAQAGESEHAFCKRFFVNAKQIRLIDAHPYASVALHTHKHLDIQTSTLEQIRFGIEENYRILTEDVGVSQIRGIAYPFGSINKTAYEQQIGTSLRERGIVYGMTTEKSVNKQLDEPYLIARYTPNDIPGGKRPIFDL